MATIKFVLYVTLLLRAVLSLPASQEIKSVQSLDNVAVELPDRTVVFDPDTIQSRAKDIENRTRREIIVGNNSCAKGMVRIWNMCVTDEMYFQFDLSEDDEITVQPEDKSTTPRSETTPRPLTTPRPGPTPRNRKSPRYRKTSHHRKTPRREKTPRHRKKPCNGKSPRNRKTPRHRKKPRHRKTPHPQKTLPLCRFRRPVQLHEDKSCRHRRPAHRGDVKQCRRHQRHQCRHRRHRKNRRSVCQFIDVLASFN